VEIESAKLRLGIRVIMIRIDGREKVTDRIIDNMKS